MVHHFKRSVGTIVIFVHVCKTWFVLQAPAAVKEDKVREVRVAESEVVPQSAPKAQYSPQAKVRGLIHVGASCTLTFHGLMAYVGCGVDRRLACVPFSWLSVEIQSCRKKTIIWDFNY